MVLSISEVVEKLKAEGFDNADQARIHHAFSKGYLKRPRMVGGSYIFSGRGVAAVRRYLANVPTPGRRAKITAKQTAGA